MELRDELIELRKSTGMNRKEFATYFEIPYRTVQDWELGNRQMPAYLLRLMAYKVRMEQMSRENMDKKGIIFDMDGTLWDSAEGVAKSWTEVVNREYDKSRVITEEEIQGVMGLTMDKIAERLFPELTEKARLTLLEQCCKEENDYLRIHGGKLYPELEETLTRLKKEYDLYIVSNCQSGYIEAFLDHYGFWKYFSDIECFGNNGLQKGENIRRLADRNGLTKAVYVGDIQGDYDATMAAGLLFIHAAYGFGTIAQEVPAIHRFKELTEVVKEVL